MSRTEKTKQAKKPALHTGADMRELDASCVAPGLPPVMIPDRVLTHVQSARRRLQRAAEVLTCLAAAAETTVEVDVAAIAITARDIIDEGLDGLVVFIPLEGDNDE